MASLRKNGLPGKLVVKYPADVGECNAPVTVKDSKWYVHLVFDWDEAEIVVKGVEAPKTVRLLRMDSQTSLEWSMNDFELRIPIRKSARGVLPDIVEIDFGGASF